MDNLNETIDYICQKVGSTAERIIPEYAKLQIVSNLIVAIMCVAVLVVVYMVFKNFNKILNKYDGQFNDSMEIFLVIFCLIAIVAAPMFLFYSLYQVTRFIVSPEAAFLSDILNG